MAEETKKEEVTLSANAKKVMEIVEKMTVLELSDLVKALEDKFGVTAAAPVMMGAMPTGVEGGNGGAEEEKTEFDVILESFGDNKVAVVKAVREVVPSLGLKDAMDLVTSAPKPVLEGAKKEDAENAKAKLEAAGAKVKLQ